MSSPIYLDATAIRDYLSCKEYYRLRYIEGGQGIEPLAFSIHRAFGIATHLSTEFFWRGQPFESAVRVAVEYMKSLDATVLSQKDNDKWQEMRAYLPDVIAAYYDAIEQNTDQILVIP